MYSTNNFLSLRIITSLYLEDVLHIHLKFHTPFDSTSSTFFNSVARQGGSIAATDQHTKLMIANCTFVRCTATHDGGALALFNSSTTLLNNSQFRAVKASQGAGGAIFGDPLQR